MRKIVKTLTSGVDKQGRLVDIDDYDKTDVDVYCPACGNKLIPKRGSQMIHHFAHVDGANCQYGYETSLLYQAKQILDQKGLFIEGCNFDKANDINCVRLRDSQIVPIVESSVGHDVDLFKPSLKVKLKDFPTTYIVIETTDTFKRSDLSKIRDVNNVSVLVIDLTTYDDMISQKTLDDFLTSDKFGHRRWVKDKDKDDRMNKYECLSDMISQTGQVKCPLRQFTEQYSSKCNACPYNFKRKGLNGIQCNLCFGRIRINKYSSVSKITNIQYDLVDRNVVAAIDMPVNGVYKTIKLHPIVKDTSLPSLNMNSSIKTLWGVARYHFLAIDSENFYYDINQTTDGSLTVYKGKDSFMKDKVVWTDMTKVVGFVSWLK